MQGKRTELRGTKLTIWRRVYFMFGREIDGSNYFAPQAQDIYPKVLHLMMF